MATHLERTITVPGSKEAAFDYVADFSNAAEWDPGIESSRRLDDGPLGVGNEFELEAEFGGRTLETKYRTTAYEPHSMVRFEGGTPRFNSTDTITFEETPDGVEITYIADFELSFPLSLAEPFFKGKFNSLADHAVAGLKDTLSR